MTLQELCRNLIVYIYLALPYHKGEKSISLPTYSCGNATIYSMLHLAEKKSMSYTSLTLASAAGNSRHVTKSCSSASADCVLKREFALSRLGGESGCCLQTAVQSHAKEL